MAVRSRARGRGGSTRPPEIVLDRLAGIRGRHAGSDAERRAAHLLAGELRATGRPATVQTVWVRSEWRLALAMAAALGLAGSIVAITRPVAGLVLALLGLAALAGDLGRRPVLRLITPTRATQNVVAPAPAPDSGRVRLILTAATDVPRGGPLRRMDAWLDGRFAVLLTASVAVVTAVVGLRVDDLDGRWLDAVQAVPTVALLALAAVLLESNRAAALAGTNAGSGPALVLALAARLDARPPENLDVDVVLAGAQDSAGALGLAEHVRARGSELGGEDVAVLHVEPCGSGAPCWWTMDGLLLPMSLHAQMLGVAERAAEAEGHLGANPYRGRGGTGAVAARRAHWPAIAIGAFTSGDPCTQPAEPAALRGSLEFASAFVRQLDRELGSRPAGGVSSGT